MFFVDSTFYYQADDIIPDLSCLFSHDVPKDSSPSSSLSDVYRDDDDDDDDDDDNDDDDDKNKFMYKRLCEIRAQNINKI